MNIMRFVWGMNFEAINIGTGGLILAFENLLLRIRSFQNNVSGIGLQRKFGIGGGEVR